MRARIEPLQATDPGRRTAADPIGKRGAWYMVAVLAALYGVSFVDRYAMGLVVDPVSHSLGLTDFQMSLVIGAGFALVYAVAGIPLANLIDQLDRRRILVAGVLLWSATTMATSLAHGFSTLLACRAGVAIGEAILTPAAVSIIADLFVAERRAAPMAVYGAVATVMGTGAFVVSGAALHLAGGLAGPSFEPWRLMFVLIGAPGAVLGLMLLATTREPPRRLLDAAAESADRKLGAFFAFLRQEWRLHIPYCLGTGIWTLCSGAMFSWTPTLMVRAHGLRPAEAGYLFGAVSVPVALAGSFAWPWLSGRLSRSRGREGVILSFLGSVLVGAPMFALAAIAPSLPLMLFGIAFTNFALAATTSVTPMTMQTYGPPRMRGRLMALNLLFKSVIGLSLGPVLVTAIAARWPGDPMALGYGLLAVGLISGLLTFALVAASLIGARSHA
jgi:MFS family permease